jgi:hypothetical protein
MKRKAQTRLRRRYGHAPAKANLVAQGLKFAPWVAALARAGEPKNLCLYEIVSAALVARETAQQLGGDKRLISRADVALNAIGSGKTRDNRTACRVASAALRKYVKAWGGSDVEADILTP